MQPGTDEVASFIAGFVAAEGTFTQTGSNAKVFRFAVALGATDAASCFELQAFLGVGHVSFSPRRKPHHDDNVMYAVQAQQELLEVIVPFIDAHLPESYKRRQYLAWRVDLLGYLEHRARRRRTCTVDGCAVPARAHGLCRHHLWELRHE